MNTTFSYLLSLCIGLFMLVSAHSLLAAPSPLSVPTIPLESPAPSASTGTCREVPLPTLGVLPDPCSSPAAYIQYWFYLGLYLAGIAALMTMVIAGTYRIVNSANPGKAKEADKYILNAVLGLILLMGSWLLLSTLGGAGLTTFQDPALPSLFQGGAGGQGWPCQGDENCLPGYSCIDPSWWPVGPDICSIN